MMYPHDQDVDHSSEKPWETVAVRPKPKRKRKKFKLPTDHEQFDELIKTLEWRRNRRFRRGTRTGYSNNYSQPWEARLAQALDALNPWSSEIWATYLLDVMKEMQVDRLDWRFVTIFDQDWDFYREEADDPEYSFASFIEKQGRLVRNRFRGFNFIFFAELAPHRVPRKFTHVFCRHWHGIVLGDNARLEKVAIKFGEGFDGAPGCIVKALDDEGGLKGLLEYITKDPRYQNVTFAKRGTSKVLHRREKLSRPNHSLLIDHYNEYAKPELAIASGLGSKILRGAIAKAKIAGYREYEGKRPPR